MTDFLSTLKEFSEACRTHDWYYDYSDDHRVWTRGKEQRGNINRLYKILEDNGLKEKADEIKAEHCPW